MGVSEEVDTSLPAGAGQILPLMPSVPIESSPEEVKLLAPTPGGALITSASISPLGWPACQFFRPTTNSSMPLSPLAQEVMPGSRCTAAPYNTPWHDGLYSMLRAREFNEINKPGFELHNLPYWPLASMNDISALLYTCVYILKVQTYLCL